jgi:hypothetical protein
MQRSFQEALEIRCATMAVPEDVAFRIDLHLTWFLWCAREPCSRVARRRVRN